MANHHAQGAILGQDAARDHPQGCPGVRAVLEQVHIRLDVRPNQAGEILDGNVGRVNVRRGRIHRLVEVHHHAHLVLGNAVVVEGQIDGNAAGLIREIQFEIDPLTTHVHVAGVQIIRGHSRGAAQADGRRPGYGIQEQGQSVRGVRGRKIDHSPDVQTLTTRAKHGDAT